MKISNSTKKNLTMFSVILAAAIATLIIYWPDRSTDDSEHSGASMILDAKSYNSYDPADVTSGQTRNPVHPYTAILTCNFGETPYVIYACIGKDSNNLSGYLKTNIDGINREYEESDYPPDLLPDLFQTELDIPLSKIFSLEVQSNSYKYATLESV